MAGESLQVNVNRHKCSGYALCADICPSVFKIDDDGFAVVEGSAPSELEAEVREAASECPAEAIIVEPAEG